MRIVGLLLLLLITLPGCGRKGGLFMPPAQQPEAQTAPDRAEQGKQP
jgi:predicted small lipoprotein YifL